MKITTTKTGKVTITDLTAGDLRFLANAIEEGSWDMDQGGKRSEMALRAARLIRAGAMYPTLTIRCAASTSDPDECFVDLG